MHAGCFGCGLACPLKESCICDCTNNSPNRVRRMVYASTHNRLSGLCKNSKQILLELSHTVTPQACVGSARTTTYQPTPSSEVAKWRWEGYVRKSHVGLHSPVGSHDKDTCTVALSRQREMCLLRHAIKQSQMAKRRSPCVTSVHPAL